MVITITKSNNKNKKFMVNIDDKTIHFGHNKYEHYTEGHLDEKRRRNYLNRALNIKDKAGNYTFNDKYSPNFWSIFFLWFYSTYDEAIKFIEKILNKKIIFRN